MSAKRGPYLKMTNRARAKIGKHNVEIRWREGRNMRKNIAHGENFPQA